MTRQTWNCSQQRIGSLADGGSGDGEAVQGLCLIVVLPQPGGSETPQRVCLVKVGKTGGRYRLAGDGTEARVTTTATLLARDMAQGRGLEQAGGQL